MQCPVVYSLAKGRLSGHNRLDRPEQRAGLVEAVAGGVEVVVDQLVGGRMQRQIARLAALAGDFPSPLSVFGRSTPLTAGGQVHFTRGDQVVGTIEATRKKTVVLSGLKFVLALPCIEC